MNTLVTSLSPAQGRYGTAFEHALSPEVLRSKVPAVYAPGAHERTSKSYTFISSERVLDALRQVGFVPVEARQAATRVVSALHARHLIRLRRLVETVSLREVIPELWILNSHDGTSAWILRGALHRAVCCNGLVVSIGTLPVWRVAHRGNVLDGIVGGALELGERFSALAPAVERMERTNLTDGERIEFARSALALRFPKDVPGQVDPSKLLEPRRPEDVGTDLWHTLQVVQEGILRGGLLRRTATNRLVHTRRITAIAADVRLNAALWDLALARAA